jgi:thiol-disulfide isomerase/thioredoxin
MKIEFDFRFIKNENVALVMFYAPWSKECKAILPGTKTCFKFINAEKIYALVKRYLQDK